MDFKVNLRLHLLEGVFWFLFHLHHCNRLILHPYVLPYDMEQSVGMGFAHKRWLPLGKIKDCQIEWQFQYRFEPRPEGFSSAHSRPLIGIQFLEMEDDLPCIALAALDNKTKGSNLSNRLILCHPDDSSSSVTL